MSQAADNQQTKVSVSSNTIFTNSNFQQDLNIFTTTLNFLEVSLYFTISSALLFAETSS